MRLNEEGVLLITTTGTQITPYRKRQNPYLEKLTSVPDPIRKFIRRPVTGYRLESEFDEPCFVTHLHNDLFLQEQFLDYRVVHVPHTQYRSLSQPISIHSDITPREVQYELIQDVLSHQDKNQWFIHLSQGLGKTLLSVFLIAQFNVKSLIMCYDKKILSQWFHTITEKTDTDPKVVLELHESKLMYDIVAGNFPVWEYDIFMCTPKLLFSFGKRYGFHLMSPLMERMGIGFKVFDEAHRNIANMIKINALTSIDKTLYLSGDFAQSNKYKEKLYFSMFHNVPIFQPTEELMNTLKFTVAIVILYNSNPTELEKASVYTRRGFGFYNFMKYQMKKRDLFNTLDLVMTQINKVNKKGYKILVLMNMIEHADSMTEYMKQKHGISHNVGRFHSKVPDDEKMQCLEECDLIVSTHQSFGTGIDISLIKYVICCTACTKIDDNQASGRARPLPDGSDAYYFMLCDYGFPWIKERLPERVQYLHDTKIKDVSVVDYR